jgi:hypothetical protein
MADTTDTDQKSKEQDMWRRISRFSHVIAQQEKTIVALKDEANR